MTEIKLKQLPHGSKYLFSGNCLIINNELSKFYICHIIFEELEPFDDKGRLNSLYAKEIRELLNGS